MTKPSRDKQFVYHLTSINNLESIVRHGLQPRSALNGAIPRDVADQDILSGRAELGLDSCVPFHFIQRTPFDYSVTHKHPDENFALLAYKREAARSLGWKICPLHPRHNPNILEWDEGINTIDWAQMDKFPRDYEGDRTCKMTCMAEALSPNSIPFADFTRIFVKKPDTEKQVRAMIARAGYHSEWPKVQVNSYMLP